ncbi:MAG: helix-turn-helix domain-containing protein [Roseburia sp.]|nr:helix-turn-helix domain-containing protein [Roseburia sp.]
MNYYEIGQRIRRYRKALNLSQEQLAEKAGISVTHMSHIETGNTKMSLSALVRIADVLSVQTDAIIYEHPQINKTTIQQELLELIDSCSVKQLNVIIDVIRSTKISLDKYYE